MSDNREVRITIRVTKEEFDFLERAAKKDDRSVSSFVRVHSLAVANDKYGFANELLERERLINKEMEIIKKDGDLQELRELQARGWPDRL